LAAGQAEGVAQMHHAFVVALHAVQQAVHQRQAAGAGHQLHADEGLVDLEFAVFCLEVKQLVGVLFDVVVGGDEKTGSAGGGVLNGFTGLRFYAVDDAVDERARGEVLPGAGFGFAGVLFQQAFVEVAETVSLCAEPVDGVEAFYSCSR
jgi:hypothetical protein